MKRNSLFLIVVLLSVIVAGYALAVELISPVDESYVNSGEDVEFTFNATSEFDETFNCTLYVNNNPLGTNESVENNTLTTIIANETLTETYNSWSVNCTDTNGNFSEGPWTLILDTAPPVITINAPGDDSWHQVDTVPINFTVTDSLSPNTTYELFVNDASNATGTAYNNTFVIVSLESLADGAYTIKVQATDLAGNAANSTEITINIDVTPPIINYVEPATEQNNANVSRDWIFIQVNVTEVNEDTITFSLYDLSGTPVNVTSFTDSTRNINWTDLAEGTYQYNVTVNDSAGNEAYTETRMITLDTTNPSVVVSSPANESWLNDRNITVEFTATDNMASQMDYAIYLNSTLSASGTASNDSVETDYVLAPEDGTYTITIVVIDEAGNNGTSETITVFVDETPPTPTITTPTETTFPQATPTINFTITDNMANIVNYTLYVDGVADATGSISPGESSNTLSALTNGMYDIILEALDEAGNAANSTPITIHVNITLPSINYAEPATSPNDTYASRNWTYVEVTVIEDDEDTITFSLYDLSGTPVNVTSYTDSTRNINWTDLAEGTYQYNVTVNNTAGNEASTETRFITLDTTDPVVTLESPENESVSSTTMTITFNFTSSDNIDTTLEYTLILNGEDNATGTTAGNDTTTSFNLTLPNGQYSWNVRVEDRAGNTGVQAENYYFSVEVPPKAIDDLNASALADGSVRLDWTEINESVNDEPVTGVVYDVYRVINASELDVTNTSQRIAVNVTNNYYIDTEIVTGTNYTYAVTTKLNGIINNTIEDNASIEATSCTTEYGDWSAWSACSGGQQSRTGTRTCYGGGNTTETETRECTTTSAPRGGGGGPPSTVPGFERAAHIWMDIKPGDYKNMSITKNGEVFFSLFIDFKAEKNRVRITMTRHGEDSPTTFTPPGLVYEYVEITSEGMTTGDGDIELEFKVPKSWMNTNNVRAENVVLMRHNNGIWTELTTRMERQDNQNHYFTATTPGFSYFAITTKTTTPTTTTPTQPTTTTTPEETTPPPEETITEEAITEETTPEKTDTRKRNTILIWGIIVLIFVGVALFFAKKNYDEKKEREEIDAEIKKHGEHHHKKHGHK